MNPFEEALMTDPQGTRPGGVQDPEDTVQLQPADLEETAVDVTDEFTRSVPTEADPADVVEQRNAIETDDEDYPAT